VKKGVAMASDGRHAGQEVARSQEKRREKTRGKGQARGARTGMAGRGARAGNRGGIARAGTPQAPAAPIEREGKRGEGGREEGAGGT